MNGHHAPTTRIPPTTRFSSKEICLILGIFVIFIALRLPALSTPYQQDEYKWPLYANPESLPPGSVPHPPLTEFIYQTTGAIFDDNSFRWTPFLFSVANLFLLYAIVRKRYSPTTALYTSAVFTLSYFSVLASLMVDTDGAVLPFFFLLALYCYDEFSITRGRKKILFLAGFFLAAFLGILVKLSFIIPIGAFLADYVIGHRRQLTKKMVVMIAASLVGFAVCFVGVLYVSQFVFPGFSLERGFTYWNTFLRGFSDRNFFQTAIQFVKALLYLSPLLVLVGLYSIRREWRQARIFYLFLLFGLVFYLILFDFSIGALDRYLQFMIIPLSVLTGLFLSRQSWSMTRFHGAWAIGVTGIIFLLQFVPHELLSHHPKTLWVEKIISLDWNFLFPFSGGSGPLGFYVSWLFIAGAWIVSLSAVLIHLLRRRSQKIALATLVILGLTYNLVFIEEYIWGRINGSAKQLVFAATEFISSRSDIQKVIVYNDNGAWNVQHTGTYYRRMYANPSFLQGYTQELAQYRGHFLLIDIPHLDIESEFRDFFESCPVIFERQSGRIQSAIYDCTGGRNL